MSSARLKRLVTDQILVQMGLPTLGLAFGLTEVLLLVLAFLRLPIGSCFKACLR